MAKELIAGVSFSDNTAQTVVLELRPESIELHHLEECQNTCEDDMWFLEAVLRGRNGYGKLSKVAIVLDNGAVFLHSFPMDSSLTQPEQNEHVQWELSNYIDDFKPKDYISDVHILRTRAKEQVARVLTVNVRRSLISSIQQSLANQKIDLELVDTNYFGAQSALTATHPETKSKVVTLAGITKNRIDAGIVMNGRLVSYSYACSQDVHGTVFFLENVMKENTSSELFLFGTGITFELTKVLRSQKGVNVMMLNPFRRIRVVSSFRGFDKFIGHEHRFASCVGAALRK